MATNRAIQKYPQFGASTQDNVLYLKHNLNAQAIGSLRSEFSALQGKIDSLLNEMKAAIDESNQFISALK